MNTRIQVEHPVTEMITNSDLVSLQLQVAAGNELALKQENILISGHAIEVRLCAEDAENNFKPSAGTLSLWRIPEHEHMRIETFVKEGSLISPNYDSLIAKLVVWSETRHDSIVQLKQILLQTGISGVHTNLSFLAGLIENEVILENRIYTRYVDENLDLINAQIKEKKQHIDKHKLVIAYLVFHLQQHKNSGNSIWNQIGFWRMMPYAEVFVDNEKLECNIRTNSGHQVFMINQKEYEVCEIQFNGSLLKIIFKNDVENLYCLEGDTQTEIISEGFSFALRSNLLNPQVLPLRKNGQAEKVFQNLICADLFGKVLKLNVSEGDEVYAGQILLILESMKTEIHVLCPVDAKVRKLHVTEGNAVIEQQLLVELAQMVTS
jgi:acetyl/propionyl-CoA carboxylase alpha subunit